MRIKILTATLGDLDKPIDPVEQKTGHEVSFYRFTDENFPPIMGLTPRFQYRIPKLFGWQMIPGYDIYIWLDGVTSFTREDSLEWYLKELGEDDMAFFHHPNRKTIKEEVDHIEEHLKLGKPYISNRYKNGLHKEQYDDILLDKDYVDDTLWASTTFIYRDNETVRNLMREWWLHQSRYFTVDQIVLPYLLWKNGVKVHDFSEPIYHTEYMSMVGSHR